MLKFADDTKLYRVVDNHQDGQMLQNDLDSVCDWADEWKMSFNVEKCKVVHYGKGSTNFTYRMHGQLLDEAISEKDLGVVFSNDLKVKQQCEEAYRRASQILGLIHRTIQFRNPSVLITLYKSMVRGSKMTKYLVRVPSGK